MQARWLAVFLLGALSTTADAQTLQDAQRAHLWRVMAWGGANAIGGTGLFLEADSRRDPTCHGFGVQSAAWGLVNIGIATVGLLADRGNTAGKKAKTLVAERNYHDILLLNMGLNVAYSSVGTAMVVASYQGVDSARAWRGHGAALIVQGTGLLVLDGIALLGSRRRLGGLLGMPGQISGSALPGGFVLRVRF